MNWCFIKHSWEYKEEMITYSSNTNKLKSVTMPTKVRLCNKCYKRDRLLDSIITCDEKKVT